jgi:hypothetical protein
MVLPGPLNIDENWGRAARDEVEPAEVEYDIGDRGDPGNRVETAEGGGVLGGGVTQYMAGRVLGDGVTQYMAGRVLGDGVTQITGVDGGEGVLAYGGREENGGSRMV